LKPTWDRLIEEFKDSTNSLIADVDCTAEGKELCDKEGIEGYPTLKYGDPHNLEDYKGKRDFDALLSFAKDNLGPSCGPAHIDLCTDEQKAKIEKFQGRGLEQLTIDIKRLDDEIQYAEFFYEKDVKKLKETYDQLVEDMETKINAAKDQDLAWLKSVGAYLKAKSAEHVDL